MCEAASGSEAEDDDRDETEAEKRPPRDIETILAADHSLIRIYSMLFALTYANLLWC